MSVFDLFRGFFGVPGGQYPGRREPFFEAMTHDEDDDEDEDGFYYDGFRGEQQDPFDSAWRFGFSVGPDGMRIQEPPIFGQLLKEMEEMFSQMGRFDERSDPGYFGVPRITRPPSGSEGRGSSGNPLRDFMLKSPDDLRPQQPTQPREDIGPMPPFHGWTPFSKFSDILRPRIPEEERKEDRDLDSAVSAGCLDQILTPPAGQTPQQPRTHSFFQSVVVTKVVKPDGSVEERRTVRDGQGNEETTVTRSGPYHEGEPKAVTDFPQPFSDMRDDSLFSKFFGGFK
ncbi:HCLS1-associated protein X-1 [Periophthalmus magnuspinnatus]|uniref:HCLS1-associated protein X-1 n=1 Tax=Periophthalmus magnuspinnatus TaxID=409849 RepID=UPI00145AE3EE|nr:HCLS1-associated protein X-1 [Periophthalmus magnuspinnatus]